MEITTSARQPCCMFCGLGQTGFFPGSVCRHVFRSILVLDRAVSTVNRLLKVIAHLLLVVLHLATTSVLPYSAAGRSGFCQCGTTTPSSNACCCGNAADRNPVPSSSACCSGVSSPGSTCCEAATARAADVADSPILTVCGCCPHESFKALCVSDPHNLPSIPQVCGAPGRVTHRFVGSLEAGLEAAAPEPPPPQQLGNATMHCKELC